MAIRLFKEIWGNPAFKNPSQISVLIYLADRANDKFECWPSIEKIAASTLLSVRTVQGVIKELRKLGFISVDVAGGKRLTNLYRIHMPPQPLHPSNDCSPATTASTPRNGCTPTPATDVPLVAPESSGSVNGNVKETSGGGRKKFLRPTEVELKNYCLPRGVDHVKFFNYYESKGWLVGKSPMVDWKAAVRTWESNQKTNGSYRNGNSHNGLQKTLEDLKSRYQTASEEDKPKIKEEYDRLTGQPATA